MILALTLALLATERFEHGGIAVDFTLERAVAGATAMATFKVTDARSGQPMAGLRPRAWFSARRDEAVSIETPCEYKIAGFVGGQLNARPDADLNGYLLLTLNHDKTITFLNPLVSSNVSRIESIVELPGAGSDWILTRDSRLLIVTIADPPSVAIVDMMARKVARIVDLHSLGKPGRVSLSPDNTTDNATAWISIEQSSQVAVVDLQQGTLRTATVGQGLHSITFRKDGKFAYVTSTASNSVTAVDTASLNAVATIQAGKTPVFAALGPASQFLYVASVNAASVAVINTATNVRVASADIPAGRGVTSIGFEPGGRFGFAVNSIEGRVVVFDTATNQITTKVAVAGEPDQIAFTRRYAYIRTVASEKFTLLDLGNLYKDPGAALRAVEIQAGRQAPGTEPQQIGPAAMIAPTPEGNSVFVASAADRMLYYYVEGGMASMGTLNNYRRMPRGVLVLDRSLTEISPGVFRAPVTLKGGRFDVPMLIDQPRLTHCFQALIEGAPAPRAGRILNVAAKPLTDSTAVSGSTVQLRFQITDPATGKDLDGLQDAQALVFAQPGTGQQRIPLEGKGNGMYEGACRIAQPGVYQVMLGIPSRNARFSDLPHATIRVSQ